MDINAVNLLKELGKNEFLNLFVRP